MFGLRTLVPLLALTMLLVAPARANTSYYTGSSGESSFNTAVAGLTLMNPALTFSGTPGSTGLLDASGTGIDFLGFQIYPTFTSSFTIVSSGLTAAGGTAEVEITFPATGIYAFGIHIAETSGSGNWCIDLTSLGPCAYNVFSSGPSNAQFFGIVSDAAVTAPLYLHPLTGSPDLVLTNFEAFDPAAAPEPRTMLLVGLGLVILPLVPRKTPRRI